MIVHEWLLSVISFVRYLWIDLSIFDTSSFLKLANNLWWLSSLYFEFVCNRKTKSYCKKLKRGSFINIMSYVTSFIVLLLLSTGAADANLGDMPSDNPTVWQYIVIALSLAFAFMAGMGNGS
jgi:hypothetical protein